MKLQQVHESQSEFFLTVNLMCVCVCLLQPGPGIACCGLWTSASTTWRSPTLSCLMTPCTSVRPQRPPCAPGGPNSMYSVSELAADTRGHFNHRSLCKGPFHSKEDEDDYQIKKRMSFTPLWMSSVVASA